MTHMYKLMHKRDKGSRRRSGCRTHRRVRRRLQSRRRNVRRRYGGSWGVPPESFREVLLYKNYGANNRFPPNLSENFNEKGEITNTQLNERLHEGRGLRSPGRFVITNIPGITHAERQNKLLTFYAGDEQIGSIIIHELATNDREDKPEWMSIL